MEDVLVFHPGPGIGWHEREFFATVITYQGDTGPFVRHGTTPRWPVPLHTWQGPGNLAWFGSSCPFWAVRNFN
jgi:hypothetical protein